MSAYIDDRVSAVDQLTNWRNGEHTDLCAMLNPDGNWLGTARMPKY